MTNITAPFVLRPSSFVLRHSSLMHLYLSPHLDDAVLSCGGQIAQAVRAGHRVCVITVFAGDAAPQVAVSPHVRELHQRWQLDPVNPMPGRRAEDLAALQTLGVDAQDIVHLTFPDCVYRLGKMNWPIYFTRDAIFGDVAEIEKQPLTNELVRALDRLTTNLQSEIGSRKSEIGGRRSEVGGRKSEIQNPQSAILLPLAAGHHVDHQIVRMAGEQWSRSQDARRRIQVIYYEDYPYAEKPEAIRAALDVKVFEAERVKLDEAALEAKIAAIACYRSQLSTFFADETEMAARVRAYAEMVGAGQPAERLWRKGNAQGDL